MKKVCGLALVASLFAGSASAGLVSLEFTPSGGVMLNSFDGTTYESYEVASTDGPMTGSLQLPTGALSMEHLGSQYDEWNQATITDGFSAFESSAESDVIAPYFDLLQGYLLQNFSNPSSYSVISAGNSFWDYDASAEANGSVDYGMNFVAFQLNRWEQIDSAVDEFGSTTTSIYQGFNFLISLADLPMSAADVDLRDADQVRALFEGLNGQSGYFYSTVGMQIDRCENNSCWQTSYASWGVNGQVRAFGDAGAPTEVPVPAAWLLLAFGLPLLRRTRA